MKIKELIERLAAMPAITMNSTLDKMPTGQLVLVARVAECMGLVRFADVITAISTRLDAQWDEVERTSAVSRAVMTRIQMTHGSARGERLRQAA